MGHPPRNQGLDLGGQKWSLGSLPFLVRTEDNICFGGGSQERCSACNAGDPGLIPVSGRSPGEGNGNPLQYPCLEKPMDRGAWHLKYMGSQRVRHDWVTIAFSRTFWPNVREVKRSLVGCHGVAHDWSDLAAAAALFRLQRQRKQAGLWPAGTLRWLLLRVQSEAPYMGGVDLGMVEPLEGSPANRGLHLTAIYSFCKTKQTAL